jgi:hypothetical protein
MGAGGSAGPSPAPMPELGGACCCGAEVEFCCVLAGVAPELCGCAVPDGAGVVAAGSVIIVVVVWVVVPGCAVVWAGCVWDGWLLGAVCEPDGTGAGGGTLDTGGCAGTVLVCELVEEGEAVVWPKAQLQRKMKIRIAKGSLRSFRWCIVSRFGINLERRQSLGRIELNFYLTPLAVSYRVPWTVAEYILVA